MEEPSMRLLRFSSSVKTSLIWSRGREVRCATHSSVQMNIFKMSLSMLKSYVGFLIATEQICLRGAVILRETLLYGERYRITFCENLTALVSSYLSIWKRGEFNNPLMVGLFFGSISKQLATRSRIRPSSFFLSRTSPFAKALRTLWRSSWLVLL